MYLPLHPTAPFWSALIILFSEPDPSSVMAAAFSNRSCDPFQTQLGCSLGTYVVYTVNVSTPDHVFAAVDFTKVNNVRLIVRNSAHEYVANHVLSLPSSFVPTPFVSVDSDTLQLHGEIDWTWCAGHMDALPHFFGVDPELFFQRMDWHCC